MRVLGIDPGSRKAGWAVIEVEGRKLKYVASGVLRFDKTPVFLDRLAIIAESITELSIKYSPESVGIESLILVKNVTSLAKLAQARGAMISGLSKKFQGKIFEYSPTAIKSAVTGHGRSDKAGVEKTLKLIFGNIDFKTDDESDALAIAVCHALSAGKPSNKIPKSGRGRTLKSVFS